MKSNQTIKEAISMKRLLPLLGAAAGLLIGTANAAVPGISGTNGTGTFVMEEVLYAGVQGTVKGCDLPPQTATVSAGDTVTWHNADTADHQVVADDGSFASPVLHADQSYSHTFTGAGTEKYYDSYARTHTGTITVSGPAPTVTLQSSGLISVMSAFRQASPSL